jgi:hypothetical protein
MKNKDLLPFHFKEFKGREVAICGKRACKNERK